MYIYICLLPDVPVYYLIPKDRGYTGEHVEGDFLDLWVGRAGAVKEKLEKLWPQVVALLVGEVARHLSGEVGALAPAILVGLVLNAYENLVLQLGFLLIRQLKQKQKFQDHYNWESAWNQD